jgi:putative pyruvate formate lyase activating enzyme
MPQVNGDPELDRRLSDEEYESLVDYAIGLGVENGFIQDGKTASESFIPEFNGYGLD